MRRKTLTSADAVRREMGKSPSKAIEELVWNACDEDATEVDVIYLRNEGSAITSIFVKDNGRGMPPDRANSGFEKFGGSYKTLGQRTPKGRLPHGKAGRGRYKSLLLGEHVTWRSVYEDKVKGKNYEFEARLSRSDLEGHDLQETPAESSDQQTGVLVSIEGTDCVLHNQGELEPDYLLPYLADKFCSYLKVYKNIKITVDQEFLDPDNYVDKIYEKKEKLGTDSFCIQVISWKNEAGSNRIYLCGASGQVLAERASGLPKLDFSYSVHIVSSYFDGETDALTDSDLDLVTAQIIGVAQTFASECLTTILKERSIVAIDILKNKDAYPYAESMLTGAEQKSKEVFDASVGKLYELRPKLFQGSKDLIQSRIRVFNCLISEDYSVRERLLEEVLRLDRQKIKQVNDVLESVEFSHVFRSAEFIRTRMMILEGLKSISGNRLIKERAQLHKIIEGELWVFGDTFENFRSDKNLGNVIKDLRGKYLKDDELSSVNDSDDSKPIEANEKQYIIDLGIIAKLPGRESHQSDFLVVELKRPGSTVGKNHLRQIEDYAAAIVEHKYFKDFDSKFYFLAISSKIDPTIAANCPGRGFIGRRVASNIVNSENVQLCLSTWSELFEGLKNQLFTIGNELGCDVEAEKGLEYLRRKYSAILK